MRALIVEDEEKLSDIVARGLKAEGFAVDVALNGTDGLEFAMSYDYDVIILDIMLPGTDGTEILSRIRKNNGHVPILMLTAKDTVADKVKHFDAGADDYLTKPFAFAELLMRVRALLKRAPTQRPNIIKIADLEIDRLAHQVKRAGNAIELSTKEYALLEYMAQNCDQVLSRTMIIEHVWDQSFEGITNIVDVYVHQLRNKVDEPYKEKLIKTIRGVGYILNKVGK